MNDAPYYVIPGERLSELLIRAYKGEEPGHLMVEEYEKGTKDQVAPRGLLPFESEGDYFDTLACIIEVMEKHGFHDEEFCDGSGDLIQEVTALCLLAKDASEMAEMFHKIGNYWYFDADKFASTEEFIDVRLNDAGVARLGIPQVDR